MTVGQRLRRELNIPPYIQNAHVVRVFGASPAIIFVVYNSLQPGRPISYQTILNQTGLVVKGSPDGKKRFLLRPVPLDSYDREVNKAWLVCLDLAGIYGIARARPVVESWFRTRLSEVTVFDLKRSNTVAPLTRRTRTQRTRAQGPENRLAKLIQVDVDRAQDHVTFKFLTDVTENIYPPGHVFKAAEPGTGTLIANPSRTYEMWLRVLNFFALLDTKPGEAPVTAADVKEVLENADVQLWSSDPSFHWQGFADRLTQIGAAIFPVNIDPVVWGPRLGGDYFLTKHLTGLVRSIEFFLNPMSQMLNKKLRTGATV